MNTKLPTRILRLFTALILAALLMSFCFAGGASPETALVGSAEELAAEISTAAASGDATILYYSAGTSAIELSRSIALPSNVTLDLSATGGTLRVPGGCVLDVSGAIVGGAVEVSGGTLLREPGSSITSTITASSGGVVRSARILTLQNLDPLSTETITGIKYAGLAVPDTSAYVTRAATAALFVRMTGSNFTSYQPIESVMTSAGNVFRLGTKYTDTLSLTYPLTYGGLTGATLSVLNPVSYTASDAAILLRNPEKEGFVFAGWTCEQLGVTMPNDRLVIPEGTTGALTILAVWVESPAGGGKSGGLTDNTSPDAGAQQQTPLAQQTPQPQQSTRHTRTASSSTKVNFSSEVESTAPSIATLRAEESFPWGWAFGGLGALGIVAYLLARHLNKRQR